MMFSDVRKDQIDVTPNISARCLDTGNDLRYNFKPGVDVDHVKAVRDGMAHFIVSPKPEPECQQTQRVLKCVLIA